MNTPVLNLDLAKVERIRAMPLAQEVLRLLRDRQRGRMDTTFVRIKRLLEEATEGRKVDIKELGTVFKALEEAGAGRLVMSKNKPVRFIWTAHLYTTACAILGENPVDKDGKPLIEYTDNGKKAVVPAQRPPRIRMTKAIRVMGNQVPAVSSDAPRQQPAVRSESSGKTVTIRSSGGFVMEVPTDITSQEAEGVSNLLSKLNALTH